jgi:uncharacterized protein YjiK
MKQRYIISVLIAAVFLLAFSQPTLRILSKFNYKISEPSDICYSVATNTFFVVSDNGYLFETDEQGKITRQAKERGYDFEGVYSDEKYVYVSEEMTRKILLFDIATLEKVGVRQLHYNGGRNAGFESITYNASKDKFIVITEKNPIKIFELDNNFLVTNEVKVKGVTDISSATYHNGKIWLLSDEDHMVLQCDANSYAIEKRYKLGVLNPEGICFNSKGEMLIVSDDMQMQFNYGKIEQ